MTYLHVYRTPSGEWSGKVLEEVTGIGDRKAPVEVMFAAREQFPNIEDLPRSPVGLTPEQVAVDVPEEFDVFCREHNVTPTDLLATFAADLLGIENEHGVTAHAQAAEWLKHACLPAAESKAD